MDIRVLLHVKDSSLGIDLYSILNREAFLAVKSEKPRFLAWEWLFVQTGNEYKRLRDFRRDALVQIAAILEVHPGLLITQQRGGGKGRKSGIWISNLSEPSIPPEARRERAPNPSGWTPPALALVPPPPPPPERLLKPATVEEFKRLYPRLDPYACKADFDAWIAELPRERQPRHYSRAFMGFARKWIVGKLVVSNP